MHPEGPMISNLDADPFFDAITKAQPQEGMAGRWMMLKVALDLLERRPNCCRDETPREALKSGLRSSSIRSAHGVSVAFEHGSGPSGSSSRHLITYKLLDPREWVRLSACNMRDNAINLADGTPITNIIISHDDFERWASDREEVFEDDEIDHHPDASEADDTSSIQQTLFSIKSQDKFREAERPRGGRPPVYNWPPVLISFLVDALYRDTKIDGQTSVTHLAEAIQAAFGEPQFAPGDTAAKEYATKVKSALVKKDKAR